MNKITVLWVVTEETFPVRYFKYEDYNLAVECMIEEIRKCSSIPYTFNELYFAVYESNPLTKDVEELLKFRREV